MAIILFVLHSDLYRDIVQLVCIGIVKLAGSILVVSSVVLSAMALIVVIFHNCEIL